MTGRGGEDTEAGFLLGAGGGAAAAGRSPALSAALRATGVARYGGRRLRRPPVGCREPEIPANKMGGKC